MVDPGLDSSQPASNMSTFGEKKAPQFQQQYHIK